MTSIPISSTEFEGMMGEVDAKLKAGGIDIPSRPISAVCEVSMRYGDIPIPLGDGTIRLPPEIEENRPIAQTIRKWYDDLYGDRIKVDMSAEKIVLEVEGELHSVRIPRVFSSVHFVAVRQWLPQATIGRGRPTCNVVQLVDDMTPMMAERLSDDGISAIWAAFETGLPACYTLENTQSELTAIARSDLQAAVSSLMDRQELYGQSKWSSLQAAEKVLKAAILLKGERFKFVHELQPLCDQLTKLGVAFDHAQLIEFIQCTPKIRYGEERCSRQDALAAHQATLVLVNRLREAGVGFRLGIG